MTSMPAIIPSSRSSAPKFDTNTRKSLISLAEAIKLPLQQGQLLAGDGRFTDVEGGQHAGMDAANGRDARDRCATVDGHGVALRPR